MRIYGNFNNKYSNGESILQCLVEQGSNFMAELFRFMMNETMKIELDVHLNTGAYKRTSSRNGYANGFNPKTLNTRNCAFTLAIPQGRNNNFYPQALQCGLCL